MWFLRFYFSLLIYSYRKLKSVYKLQMVQTKWMEHYWQHPWLVTIGYRCKIMHNHQNHFPAGVKQRKVIGFPSTFLPCFFLYSAIFRLWNWLSQVVMKIRHISGLKKKWVDNHKSTSSYSTRQFGCNIRFSKALHYCLPETRRYIAKLPPHIFLPVYPVFTTTRRRTVGSHTVP